MKIVFAILPVQTYTTVSCTMETLKRTWSREKSLATAHLRVNLSSAINVIVNPTVPLTVTMKTFFRSRPRKIESLVVTMILHANFSARISSTMRKKTICSVTVPA